MHLRKPFVSPFRGLMRRAAAHAVLCPWYLLLIAVRVGHGPGDVTDLSKSHGAALLVLDSRRPTLIPAD